MLSASATAPGGSGSWSVWGVPLLVLLIAALDITAVTLVTRWRAACPWRWWRWVGAPVAAWRVGRTWRAACEGAGLSVPGLRVSRLAVLPIAGRGGGRRGGLVVRCAWPRPG